MKTIDKDLQKGKYKGLTQKEAELSAERFGKNIMSKQKKKSFMAHFLSNLNDPVIRI